MLETDGIGPRALGVAPLVLGLLVGLAGCSSNGGSGSGSASGSGGGDGGVSGSGGNWRSGHP